MDIDKEIEEAKKCIKALEKEVELSRLYRRINELEREKLNPFIAPIPLDRTCYPKYDQFYWSNQITADYMM